MTSTLHDRNTSVGVVRRGGVFASSGADGCGRGGGASASRRPNVRSSPGAAPCRILSVPTEWFTRRRANPYNAGSARSSAGKMTFSLTCRPSSSTWQCNAPPRAALASARSDSRTAPRRSPGDVTGTPIEGVRVVSRSTSNASARTIARDGARPGPS